jgi:cytochrome c oxidase subunit II
MNFLLIIAVILGVLVVTKLLSVVQLTSHISNEDEDKTQTRHDYLNGIGLLIFMVLGLFLTVYMTIKYQPFMLPESASKHGVEIDTLLNINFAIIGLVFFATQILLFWFVYKYRHSSSRRAYFYPDNMKLEVIWTVIPTIVLSVLIITGLSSWNRITKAVDNDNGMVVQIYGYQFNWITRYAGDDNTLGKSSFRLIADDNPLGVDFSDPAAADDIMTKSNEMYLPVNVPILFEFNSRDVIHSVYLPHFRTQMNCVPGMTTKFYMEPTITTAKMREITGNDKFDYVLVCNKICGVAHYSMKMKVVVVEQTEYDNWLKGERPVIPVPEYEVTEDNTTIETTVNDDKTAEAVV